MEDLDPAFAANAQPGDVIVAGRNWGCGSSREQAVTSLKLCGITAIIAESFGGLYFRNCINQGVYPMALPGLRDLLRTGDVIEIDRENGRVIAAGQLSELPPRRIRYGRFWTRAACCRGFNKDSGECRVMSDALLKPFS